MPETPFYVLEPHEFRTDQGWDLEFSQKEMLVWAQRWFLNELYNVRANRPQL